MLNKHALDSSFIPAEPCLTGKEGARVIKEFRVNENFYQVIVLNRTVPEADIDADIDDILSSLFPQSDLDSFSEITHFTVGGQVCLIVETCHAAAAKEHTADIQALLTERELQIAALVAFGKVNKQIAKQLHISEWTVATYLRRMFAKLRVDSRAALVYRCAPLIRKCQELSQPIAKP